MKLKEKAIIKKTVFLKIYITVVITVMAIIAAGWIVLWNFTDAYETSRPEHAMENVIEQFESADYESIISWISYSVSVFESEDVVKQQIADKLGDGNWEFNKKTSEYSKSAPVYQVKKDGSNIAVVYFKLEEKRGSFNTPKWFVDRIEGMVDASQSYTINVPKDSKVMVNGIELDSSYIKEESVECSNLGNVSKYIEAPTLTAYTIEGLYGSPEIKAFGPVYGTELNIQEDKDNTLEFAFESNEEFISEQSARVLEISRIYGRYISNHVGFSDISPYIMQGSYAYDYLSKIVNTNKWFVTSYKTESLNMEAYNFQNYTENCFACDVSFDYVIHMPSEDRVTPTHIRYVFINKSGNWYVADMSLKE